MPRRKSRTIRMRWRLPRSMSRACRTSGWCCSKGPGGPGTASCFTPIWRAPRGGNCSRPARRRSASTGRVLRRQVRVRGDGRAGQRRGGGRLFRHAAARQPAGCLGVPAIAAAGEPFRSRKGRRPLRRAICHRRDPPPASLVGLPAHPGRDRILARPSVPPARPAGVPARRPRTALGEDPPLSLIGDRPWRAALLPLRAKSGPLSRAGDDGSSLHSLRRRPGQAPESFASFSPWRAVGRHEQNDPKRSFSKPPYSITSSAAQRSHGPNHAGRQKRVQGFISRPALVLYVRRSQVMHRTSAIFVLRIAQKRTGKNGNLRK